MSDRVATIAISAVALVCCLGLPLVLAAGAGALVWIVGAGAPLVILAALGAWVFARRGPDRTHGRPAGTAHWATPVGSIRRPTSPRRRRERGSP